MAEEATLDRIVFAAVTGKVCDMDQDADRFTELLKVVLEQMAVGSIAAATVA